MARPTGRTIRSCQGQHPATGDQLVRQRASYEYQDADGKTVKTMEHRAGWGATFSAPKSVSLTALSAAMIGSAKRIARAFALRWNSLKTIPRHASAVITRRKPRPNSSPQSSSTTQARPVDGYVAPQLHTHAVVFNITERENGQYRAV
jgi:conjugative relaxase-like TrwC/TraI family protein